MFELDVQLLAELRPANVERMDREGVQTFNRIAARTAPSLQAEGLIRLQHEIGPFVYDGRPETARLAILTGNPGFGDDSTSAHHAHASPGWSIAGLSPDAPAGTRRANQDLFAPLMREHIDASRLSDTCLKLELIPWASRAMITRAAVRKLFGGSAIDALHDALAALPSRPLIAHLACQLMDRGCLVAVLRGHAGWRSSQVPIDSHPSAMVCTSANTKPLAAYKLRRYPGGWERIVAALRER